MSTAVMVDVSGVMGRVGVAGVEGVVTRGVELVIVVETGVDELDGVVEVALLLLELAHPASAMAQARRATRVERCMPSGRSATRGIIVPSERNDQVTMVAILIRDGLLVGPMRACAAVRRGCHHAPPACIA
jgi:hypothetical protein